MGWTFYNASGQQLRATADKAATQAEMEAATSSTVFATPARTQYHPGVAKVWVQYEQTGAHSIIASYNMTSVTDGGGVGDSDLLFATDFSGTDYALAGAAATQVFVAYGTATQAATGITIFTEVAGTNARDDSEATVIFFGDQ